MCRGVGVGPRGDVGGLSFGRLVGDMLPDGVSLSRSTSCRAGDALGLALGGSLSGSAAAVGPSQLVAFGGDPPGLLAAAANAVVWESLRPGDGGGDSDSARASCASSAAVAAASECAARAGVSGEPLQDSSLSVPRRSSSRSRIVLAPACAWNSAQGIIISTTAECTLILSKKFVRTTSAANAKQKKRDLPF
jgi:hypothetical protein